MPDGWQPHRNPIVFGRSACFTTEHPSSAACLSGTTRAPIRPATCGPFSCPRGNYVKISTAFASLIAASIAVSHIDTTPLMMVLILVALWLAFQGAFVVLYVCRKADRKDLRKLIQVWRAR